jgi:signal transduction histidine kinase
MICRDQREDKNWFQMPGNKKHLGAIVLLLLTGVLLYYLGDLSWLGGGSLKNGFLAGQAYHEMCLLVITVSVIYATIIFRLGGGIIASLMGSAALVPHALFFSTYQDPFFREATFAIISLLLTAFIGTLLNSRDRITVEQQRLEIFISQTLERQELERQYLAHELHDETAQELVDISHRIDELLEDKNGTRPYVANTLTQLRHDVDRVLEGTRRLIQGIRPPLLEELGLKPALLWLVDQTAEEAGIEIRLGIVEPMPRIAGAVEMSLFRIAQEALTNAKRHSQATQIDLAIMVEGKQVVMKVTDNGAGFHVPNAEALVRRGKFGIMGIMERARLVGGDVQVESVPGIGTTVIAQMPLGDDNRNLRVRDERHQ